MGWRLRMALCPSCGTQPELHPGNGAAVAESKAVPRTNIQHQELQLPQRPLEVLSVT